jgi:membrane peptidoglycan carboxypeptidase
MSATIADEVTTVMGDVVSYGTGTAARQPFPIYGKTGTTDDYTNAWFTGCTRAVCITVWMGYDKPYKKIHGTYVAHELRDAYGAPVFGGTVPAEIFSRIFTDYHELDAPPAAIGASPYPTYVPTTTSPTASPKVGGSTTPAPGGNGPGGPGATTPPSVPATITPTR